MRFHFNFIRWVFLHLFDTFTKRARLLIFISLYFTKTFQLYWRIYCPSSFHTATGNWLTLCARCFQLVILFAQWKLKKIVVLLFFDEHDTTSYCCKFRLELGVVFYHSTNKIRSYVTQISDNLEQCRGPSISCVLIARHTSERAERRGE